MANDSFEDAPFGIFRTGYSIITWLSTLLLLVITVWTVWTMFMNTPAGTRRSQQLAIARPTADAIATRVAGETPLNACMPPKPDGIATCTACHMVMGAGNQVCPNLTDIRQIALERIAEPGYTGAAKTAEEDIHESIAEPSAFVVSAPEGKVYGSPGASIMPVRGGLPETADLDAYVAYLMFDPNAEWEESVASR